MPFPSAGYLPNPEIDSVFLMSPALAGGFFTAEPLGESLNVDWDSILLLLILECYYLCTFSLWVNSTREGFIRFIEI